MLSGAGRRSDANQSVRMWLLAMTIKTCKTIYQLRYKAHLEFYDKLMTIATRFSEFPHWETNRLRVTHKDVEAWRSLSINHDSVAYDTDKPDKDFDKEIISKINDTLREYIQEEDLLRVGFRQKIFVKSSLPWSDLKAVTLAQFYSAGVIEITGARDTDSTAVFLIHSDALTTRITVGPLQRSELPRFLEVSWAQHTTISNDASLQAEYFAQFPETGLYFDIDVFSVEVPLSFRLTVETAESAVDAIDQYVTQISRLVFG